VTHLVEVIAQLANQRFFGVRSSQEPSIWRQRVEGTKESQTLHDSTDKRIYRNQAFSLQFAERHMNCPLILARSVETVERQISAFTDAHAGMTNQ